MRTNSLTSPIRGGRGLSTLAAATVVVMVLVILWGAVVRATGSGAGCGANWPLCNGGVFPHHPRIQTIIEFTHRATTGVCSTLALILLAWVFVARPRGERTRKAAVVSSVLLALEAYLGRALVLHGWVDRNTSDARAIMQCVHFTNTLMLLAAFTVTWWWLRNPSGGMDRLTTTIHARVFAWLAVALTIVTGATGSVAALADTLFPSPSVREGLTQDFAANAPLLVRMRWMHPAAAVLAFVAAIVLCRYVSRAGARWIGGLLVLQVVLGVADMFALAPVTLQVLHLLGADLFWIALVAVASELIFARQAANATTERAVLETSHARPSHVR